MRYKVNWVVSRTKAHTRLQINWYIYLTLGSLWFSYNWKIIIHFNPNRIYQQTPRKDHCYYKVISFHVQKKRKPTLPAPQHKSSRIPRSSSLFNDTSIFPIPICSCSSYPKHRCTAPPNTPINLQVSPITKIRVCPQKEEKKAGSRVKKRAGAPRWQVLKHLSGNISPPGGRSAPYTLISGRLYAWRAAKLVTRPAAARARLRHCVPPVYTRCLRCRGRGRDFSRALIGHLIRGR